MYNYPRLWIWYVVIHSSQSSQLNVVDESVLKRNDTKERENQLVLKAKLIL